MEMEFSLVVGVVPSPIRALRGIRLLHNAQAQPVVAAPAAPGAAGVAGDRTPPPALRHAPPRAGRALSEHERAAAPAALGHRVGRGDLQAGHGARGPDHSRRRPVVAAGPPLRPGPLVRLLRRHVRAVWAVPPHGAAGARL